MLYAGGASLRCVQHAPCCLDTTFVGKDTCFGIVLALASLPTTIYVSSILLYMSPHNADLGAAENARTPTYPASSYCYICVRIPQIDESCFGVDLFRQRYRAESRSKPAVSRPQEPFQHVKYSGRPLRAQEPPHLDKYFQPTKKILRSDTDASDETHESVAVEAVEETREAMRQV
jgi:hypothetical protein